MAPMTPVRVRLAYRVAIEPRPLVLLACRMGRVLQELEHRCSDLSDARVLILVGQVFVEATVLAESGGSAVGKVQAAAVEAAGDVALGVAEVLECRPVVGPP